ncbi:LacI family DNA-binding transcriptional regulator [Ligilactobacillus acidipiscis]|uniref:LacI family DNA-binding transcriptional regulator n=1 Tax=Ligilactobacillus acidipiscis TaxID=89059 RepID=UPI0023F98C6A|nr:LacI family DNA-binding transcriptional regulator [Ligilactobacillus acidipiscis]WEV56260.1 LacI family DNA-binding transcriptional regulator [Ligilactobacillus acidipiscis]
MNSKKVSIKDVALQSDVSVATVSRILNNTGRFSSKTATRVMKVANDLGYRQNRLAVGLRSKESNTIGILVPDITNEFFSKIVKKCEQFLFSTGYSTIICNTDRSEEREREYYRTLLDHQIDGLIIISTSASQGSKTIETHIPTVFIDRKPSSDNESVVSSDHYEGGRIITEYLLNDGRVPYLIMTKTKSTATIERVKAFKDVLQKRGFKKFNQHIYSLNMTSDKFLDSDKELKDILSTLIERKEKIGIFAINDNIAYMVIRAAKQLDIEVPKTISVIGFDGTSYSEISSPQITTIKQNVDLISKRACELLLAKMQKKNEGKKQNFFKIPVELVVRQSS